MNNIEIGSKEKRELTMSDNTNKHRTRNLGTLFDGEPGQYNVITGIQAIAVGHCTLIGGKGNWFPAKAWKCSF
jgi:hypothetical protein